MLIDRHPARVEAGHCTTEPGDETKAPGLVGDGAQKALVPFVVVLAQRADQHGCTVVKRFDPMFTGLRLFDLLLVHAASRWPDR